MSRPTHDYHVVMIQAGQGVFAVSGSQMLWSDALDSVHDAACDGLTIEFVHHRAGRWDDRTQEALEVTRKFLSEFGSPITEKQKAFLAHHFGADVANAFECEAA